MNTYFLPQQRDIEQERVGTYSTIEKFHNCKYSTILYPGGNWFSTKVPSKVNP